jgi:hypothetical protein
LAYEEFEKKRYDHIEKLTAKELELDDSDPYLVDGQVRRVNEDESRLINPWSYIARWDQQWGRAWENTDLKGVQLQYLVAPKPVPPIPELPESQFPRPPYDDTPISTDINRTLLFTAGFILASLSPLLAPTLGMIALTDGLTNRWGRRPQYTDQRFRLLNDRHLKYFIEEHQHRLKEIDQQQRQQLPNIDDLLNALGTPAIKQ